MFCTLPPEKLSFMVFVIGPYGPSGGERIKRLGSHLSAHGMESCDNSARL